MNPFSWLQNEEAQRVLSLIIDGSFLVTVAFILRTVRLQRILLNMLHDRLLVLENDVLDHNIAARVNDILNSRKSGEKGDTCP